MAPQLHETRMGRIFYESTMPRIAENLERLVKVNERLLEKMPDKKPWR